MNLKLLWVPLAAAVLGVPAIAMPAAAVGAPEVAGVAAAQRVTDPSHLVNDPRFDQTRGSAAQRVTDPSHLVNDPRFDQTRESNAQNTPSLAGLGSTVVASYNDGIPGAPDFVPYVGYSVSDDSGATWRDLGEVSGTQWEARGAASVAADADRDRFYLAARGAFSAAPDDDQILVFPIDGAGALGSPVPAAGGGPDDEALNPWVAVDNFPGAGHGTVYVAYSPGSDGLRLARSTDGATTWSPPTEIDIEIGGFSQPRVIVSPDHCVHVVFFESLVFTPDQISLRTSCDGGLTFQPEVVVATLLAKNFGTEDGDLFLDGSFASNSTPQIAVSPLTGALYVVYNDLVSEDGDADVYLTSSSDGGATWSPPARVNADGGDHDQFSPVVAVTDDGSRLIVSYYDRRSDPINVDLQRWGRIGVIDLASDAVRLRNEFQLGPSFPPVKDTQVSRDNVFSGHEAVIALGGRFVAAWTDNRDGDQVSYFQSDVRSAVVPSAGPTDVSVTVEAADDVLALGDTYTYTATVRNGSQQPAGNVAVRTPLPLGTKFLSATLSGPGACYRLGQNASCLVGTLEPGESTVMTVTAQALRPGSLRRSAAVTTSSLERRLGDDAAAAEGQVAAAARASERFTTGDIAVPISSSAPTVVPVDVAGPGTALDVEVGVRLDHSNVELLSIVLVDPAGVEIPLSLQNGASTGRDYGDGSNTCSGTPAIFDDAAKTSVLDARGPFVRERTYNPEGTLSDALGGSYDGTWQLVVSQRSGTNRGEVGCVGLRIRHTA